MTIALVTELPFLSCTASRAHSGSGFPCLARRAWTSRAASRSLAAWLPDPSFLSLSGARRACASVCYINAVSAFTNLWDIGAQRGPTSGSLLGRSGQFQFQFFAVELESSSTTPSS